jgi:hypothetical protein
MSSDSGEETGKYLFKKYITNQKYVSKDDDDEEQEGYLLRKSEDLVDGINQFISRHIDEAAKLKIEKSKGESSQNSSLDTSMESNKS